MDALTIVALADHPHSEGHIIWDDDSGWTPVDPTPTAYQTREGVLLCWSWCAPRWQSLAVLELFPDLAAAQAWWRSLGRNIPKTITKPERTEKDDH